MIYVFSERSTRKPVAIVHLDAAWATEIAIGEFLTKLFGKRIGYQRIGDAIIVDGGQIFDFQKFEDNQVVIL